MIKHKYIGAITSPDTETVVKDVKQHKIRNRRGDSALLDQAA